MKGKGDEELPEPRLKRKPVVLRASHQPGHPFSLLTKPALEASKDPAQPPSQTCTHLCQALPLPGPGPLHVEGGV